MHSNDAIAATLTTSDMVLRSYVGDLTDSELLTRPGKDCNHIAWQLGNLISADCELLNSICPGKGIELPEGFRDSQSKENASCDDPTKFASKQTTLSCLT